MATSPNGAEYTHSVLIQDIKRCGDFELRRNDARFVIGGKKHKLTITANPGVWYIDKPLDVKVGDIIDSFPYHLEHKYLIVDIGEYPPQPTLRTLYMVIPEDAK